MRLAAGAVIGADHQQPGVLALRPGVGLERDRGEAGDLRQLILQLAEEQLVARRLVARGERMQPVELPPAHRHHLGRRVELHGAGAERDHRRGEREVSRLEPLDVAQHLGLGVMPVEHRVLEIRALPLQRRRDGALRLHADVVQHEGQRLVQREDRDEVGEVAQGDGLVERDAEPGGGQRAQVDLPHPGGVQQAGQGPLRHLDAQGVEVRLVHDPVAEPSQRVRQQHGAGVHPLRDPAEAAGAVIDGVHARHHRQQHLRGADVARRLVAPDVLLAGLERHPKRGRPSRSRETPMMRPGMNRLYVSRVAKNAACGPP